MVIEMTPGGYPKDEVVSALQKAIRRGTEKDALYWAVQLFQNDPDKIWERLRIIASEDVGLASPTAVTTVRALYDNYKEKGVDKNDEGRLFLIHAVLVLVRSEKSRIVDHALITVFNEGFGRREVPDYAKDKHTASGRRLMRGFEHFFDEGATLENCNLPDDYEESARMLLTTPKEAGATD